ncbi:MAG: hypothetical protein ACOCSR_02400, partial [Wenzhouxiangella sp.]
PERHLPGALLTIEVFPDEPGHVGGVDVRELGLAVVELGGGRHRAGDAIDPSVGLDSLAGIGEQVEADRPLARIHARDRRQAERAAARVRSAYFITDTAPQAPPLIADVIRQGEA